MIIERTSLGLGQTTAITPPNLIPSIPIGYDAPTGTVASSNTTGLTTTPGYSSNPNIEASSSAANSNAETACETAGGSWDDTNGCTATDYTPYYVAAGVILLLVFLMGMKK